MKESSIKCQKVSMEKLSPIYFDKIKGCEFLNLLKIKKKMKILKPHFRQEFIGKEKCVIQEEKEENFLPSKIKEILL